MDRSAPVGPLAAGIEREIHELYEKDAPGMLRYAFTVAGTLEAAQDAVQEAFLRYFIGPVRRPGDPVPESMAVPRVAQPCARSKKGWLAV